MSQRQRILVVDDEPLNLSIMSEILEDDYDLVMATSGEECLTLAQVVRPNLILLDIMLPGIDGYETCRQLRQDPVLRYVKVILVSAKSQLEERLQGYEVQADDYVMKPFDADELMAKVRVMLRLEYFEELDYFKGQFLDLLAHETRTPLTGIISPAQFLLDGENITEEERREMTEMILDSAHSLHDLVQGTVDLVAFKSGRAKLKIRPIDLATIVGRLSAQLLSCAREKSMSLEIGGATSLPLNGDGPRLDQVLRIILENAIGHGLPGSSIQIRLDNGAGGVAIEVENEGKILSEEQLPHVFNAFQVEDVDHHSHGVGIDLALAREIALAHGGDIECRAASADSMLFRLVLPAGAPRPDDTRTDVAELEPMPS